MVAPAAIVAGAMTALETIGKVKDFIDKNDGDLVRKSDKVSYPAGVKAINSTFAPFVERGALLLYCPNIVTRDDHISFRYQGNFGFDSNDDGSKNPDRPVMANVFFDVGENSDVYGTKVDFQATASDTAVGTPKFPKIQFVVTGSFASKGHGSCRYAATLEIDHHGNVATISSRVINGKAAMIAWGGGRQVTLDGDDSD